jgi:SAM-dependent methyltransferase
MTALPPLSPLSDCYGYDRGTPADRPYIEAFLAARQAGIHGDGAEVKDSTYLTSYGAHRLASITIIDIDPGNAAATLRADLAAPGSLPAAAFDVIILTQVLQLLADPAAALDNCARALRPGGTLLLTVPCLGRISPSAAGCDRWRWTPAGLTALMAAWLGPAEITAHGNAATCVAAILGAAREDLPAETDLSDDPRFPLIACAAATRAGQPAR